MTDSTATTDVELANDDVVVGSNSIRKFLASTPLLVWILILIVLPNLLLIAYSLWKNDLGTITRTFTFDNYFKLFGSEVFRTLLVRTLVIALVSAGLATFIAYTAALIIVQRFPRFKALIALLVLVPLLVSYLMRVFAWKIILGDSGILTSLLRSLGFGDEAGQALLYSRTSVILTLTYVCIPYVFLSAYTGLDRIPGHLLEASADCGAGPWRTFRKVVWPLSRPAVAVGFAIAFVLAFGDYVTPAMVGGLDGTMLGSLVLQNFGAANNWPMGAAVGISIVVTGLVFLGIISLFTKSEAPLES